MVIDGKVTLGKRVLYWREGGASLGFQQRPSRKRLDKEEKVPWMPLPPGIRDSHPKCMPDFPWFPLGLEIRRPNSVFAVEIVEKFENTLERKISRFQVETMDYRCTFGQPVLEISNSKHPAGSHSGLNSIVG